MLKTLLALQLASLKNQMTGAGRRGKKSSAGKGVLMAVLFLYVFVVFGFLFYVYFDMMAQPFHDSGTSWLYFALLIFLSFALMFIGSVFTAKAQLFEPKDTELLLSMPIQPPAILASRLMALLILNYVLELVAVIAASLAWFTRYSLPPMGAVGLVLILLLLPLLSLAISSLFAWLLSVLTRKIRRKALFSLVLSLIFLGGYMYLMFQLNDYITQIIAHLDAVAQAIGAIAPLYWMGSAIAGGNILHLVLSLAVLLVPFAIAFFILSATFVRTATSQHGLAKIRYVEREQNVCSPFGAFLKKESQRLTSSATYMLNAGLGLVFLVIGSVYLLLKGDTLVAAAQQMELLDRLLTPGLLVLVGMMNAMTLITASSVSLEGKSIWIPQSMPVSARIPLQAKLALQVMICLPVMILASAAIAITMRPSGLMLLCTLLLPQVYAVFSAVVGLVLNLNFPNLAWRNEAQVVKNGASILLTMLVNFGSAIVAIGVLIAGMFAPQLLGWLLLAYTLLLVLLAWLLYRWAMKQGAARFMTLS